MYKYQYCADKSVFKTGLYSYEHSYIDELLVREFDAWKCNDGWVDRECNTFIYHGLYFDVGIKVGSKVMIGECQHDRGWSGIREPKPERPVFITKIERCRYIPLTYYHFKDI